MYQARALVPERLPRCLPVFSGANARRRHGPDPCHHVAEPCLRCVCGRPRDLWGRTAIRPGMLTIDILPSSISRRPSACPRRTFTPEEWARGEPAQSPTLPHAFASAPPTRSKQEPCHLVRSETVTEVPRHLPDAARSTPPTGCPRTARAVAAAGAITGRSRTGEARRALQSLGARAGDRALRRVLQPPSAARVAAERDAGGCLDEAAGSDPEPPCADHTPTRGRRKRETLSAA